MIEHRLSPEAYRIVLVALCSDFDQQWPGYYANTVRFLSRAATWEIEEWYTV